jgi:hypothetical protein
VNTKTLRAAGACGRRDKIRALMEAEQLNQLANTLADLKARSAEMRRLL